MSVVDQETLARITEMDLMAADVERANSRVAEMERRNVRFMLILTLVD